MRVVSEAMSGWREYSSVRPFTTRVARPLEVNDLVFKSPRSDQHRCHRSRWALDRREGTGEKFTDLQCQQRLASLTLRRRPRKPPKKPRSTRSRRRKAGDDTFEFKIQAVQQIDDRKKGEPTNPSRLGSRPVRARLPARVRVTPQARQRTLLTIFSCGLIATVHSCRAACSIVLII
jgi:hypothetical protein